MTEPVQSVTQSQHREAIKWSRFANPKLWPIGVLDSLWVAALTLIVCLFFFRLIDLSFSLVPDRIFSDGIGTADVGPFSKNKATGVGYFPELAKSFLKGHLYLDREYNPSLLTHPNPYGVDAYEKGIVIADAALYKDRYYIYYGPVPVLLMYLPFHAITGLFPSDALIILVLAACYATMVAVILRRTSGPRDWRLLPAFCLLFANPVMLKSLVDIPTMHGVSRVLAGTCVVTSAYFLLILQSRIQIPNCPNGSLGTSLHIPALVASVFACLAIATRVTAFPDLLGLMAMFAILVWQSRRKIAAGALALSMVFLVPIVATVVGIGIYNYQRFDNAMEFGVRYLTLGSDFLHGGSVVRPPHDIVMAVYNVGYKVYEYFLLLPNFESATAMSIRYDTRSPFIFGAYTEGAIGLLAWAPILLFVPGAIWLALNAPVRDGSSRFAKPFLLLGALQFGASFFLISSIPLTAYHYCLEMLPRLSLVLAGLMLCNSRQFMASKDAPFRTLALVSTVMFSTSGVANMHLF